MEEHEVAVIENHTLGGASTITLMKDKHRYVALVKSTRMDRAITVVIIWCCDDFQVDQCKNFLVGRCKKILDGGTVAGNSGSSSTDSL